MRRKFSLVLIVILSMCLIVTPVLAKGGNGSGGGNSGGNSNGNGGGGNQVSSQAGSSEKSDSSKSASIEKGNSSKSESAVKSNTKSDSNVKTNNPGQIKKQESLKPSKNKVTEGMSEQQINTAKEKLTQKRAQVQKKNFKDTSTHWAQKDIARVQSLGLISGYQDGSFQPDSPVTSAEAMVMAVNLAETLGTDQLIQEDVNTETPAVQDTTSPETTTNTDVPKWAESKAKVASQLRIVNMNRFHSTVQASRAQTAVMLAKALNLDPVDTSGTSFSDSVLISSEDLGYILALKEAGIIFGSTDGKFNPNKNVTRAEIAAMLDRAVDTVEDDEDTTAGTTEPTTGTTEESTGTTPTTGTTDSTGTTPTTGTTDSTGTTPTTSTTDSTGTSTGTTGTTDTTGTSTSATGATGTTGSTGTAETTSTTGTGTTGTTSGTAVTQPTPTEQ